MASQASSPAAGRLGNIVRLVISLALLAATAWLLLNRQYVLDQLTLLSYQPSDQVEKLAEATTMNDTGRFYFYASEPQLQGRDAFNRSCAAVGSEQSAVLGCYSGQNIYIFNIEEEKLDGIREVTAAHEMLHAAYDRLNDTERQRIDELVEAEAERIEDPTIKRVIAEYAETEPGERKNELHSIIGTQVADIGDELEKYYARYFTDRSKVVDLYQHYNSVFEELKTKQERLIEQLETLATSINTTTERYNRDAARFAADAKAYENRTYTSQTEADQDRQTLLARQSDLRDRRAAIEADRTRYDRLRTELEALNARFVSLNHTINSSLEPVQPVQ